MKEVIGFTIISRNYMPFARTLAQSFKRHNPDYDFFVVVIDDTQESISPRQEAFSVVRIEDVGVVKLKERALYYDVTEFSTSVKPDVFLYLMKQGARKVIYLDPDIAVYAPLSPLSDLLDEHSILLTPHALSPINDGRYPNELDLLKTGAYNMGFAAVKNDSNGTAMLEWWSRRLLDNAFVDIRNGQFTDQKWMDLTPSFFAGVHILKDPGYNMAYWNLHERTLSGTNGHYLVNEVQPLRFFHFSGINTQGTDNISKYQNRFNLRGRSDLAEIFKDYAAQVNGNTTAVDRSYKYEYSTFDDGSGIDSLTRRMFYFYQAQNPVLGDPFAFTGRGSFHAWLKDHQLLLAKQAKQDAWEEEKVLHKPEEIIFTHYRRQFRVIAQGFRALRQVLGAKRYEQLIGFMNYITNTSRHPHVYFGQRQQK